MNLKERSSASRQTITTMNNTANSTTTKRLSTRKLVLIALMTAITCIFAPMAIPIPVSPVPISLTNLVIMISIYVLGFKDATISYIVYLLLGLVGLPVFSGFTGGLGKLAGPTGGYLIGFIFLALIAGLFVDKFPKNRILAVVGMLIGMAITYIFGTEWLAIQLKMSFVAALSVGVIPYLAGDAVKIIIAIIVGPVLNNTANSTTTKRLSTRKLVLIALMTAITCIFAPMAIPIPVSPVPISLTNLVIMISIYVLGFKDATISYIVYLLLGLVGLPVFSGFTGGLGKLAGPTGGYLIGFIFLALIAGLFVDKFPKNRILAVVGMLIGMAITYIFGTEWLAIQLKMSFVAALSVGVIPYLAGDAVKIIIAIIVGPVLRSRLSHMQ